MRIWSNQTIHISMNYSWFKYIWIKTKIPIKLTEAPLIKWHQLLIEKDCVGDEKPQMTCTEFQVPSKSLDDKIELLYPCTYYNRYQCFLVCGSLWQEVEVEYSTGCFTIPGSQWGGGRHSSNFNHWHTRILINVAFTKVRFSTPFIDIEQSYRMHVY